MIDRKILDLIKKSAKNSLSDEEKACCLAGGFLTQNEPLAHDDVVIKIKQLAENISLEQAAKSFLYSISSGDRRYRTILSSLIWARSLPFHEYEKNNAYVYKSDCGVCGLNPSGESGKADFPVLEYARQRLFPTKNFMDTCSAGYVLHDLMAFQRLPGVDFSEEDLRILNRLLGLAGEVSPTNKVNAWIKLVSADRSLPLAAADAYSIMGVLSSCGVFDTSQRKSYANGFVRCDGREFVYETDIYYPLHLWRGKNGINYAAIESFFGAVTDGRLTPENRIRGSVDREQKELTTNVSKAAPFFTEGEHIIDLDDRQRYYYGLAPIDPTWDRVVVYSSTHNSMKRSEVFFEGDRVKKVILEQKRLNRFEYYLESDMDVATRKRQMILPKTDRGREQNLTPSLLMTPAYMLAQLHVYLKGRSSGASTFNSSNDQELPLPAGPIETREDFTRFTEEYIASCPADYGTQLDRFIHKKRVKARFTSGDIFRAQISTTQYTYGLILGKVRQLEKWPEIPKGHPILLTMSQPLLIRQYDIITENPNMTAEELSTVSLMNLQIAQDNEIIWETYPIVCHKELSEEDIDLGFSINSKMRTIVWGLSMHVFDESSWTEAGFEDTQDAHVCINGDRSLSMTYGVTLGIRIDQSKETGDLFWRQREDRLNQMKNTIARILGLDPKNACDDFAIRYGGLTRKQFIKLAKVRFKK